MNPNIVELVEEKIKDYPSKKGFVWIPDSPSFIFWCIPNHDTSKMYELTLGVEVPVEEAVTKIVSFYLLYTNTDLHAMLSSKT